MPTMWSQLKPLEEKQTRLKTELAAVEYQIAQVLKAFRGAGPSGAAFAAANPSPAKPAAKAAKVDNLRGKIRDLLEANPGTSYDGSKVAAKLGLPKSEHRAIRKALQNLAAKGEVKRVTEGKYQAKAPKAPARKAPAKKG